VNSGAPEGLAIPAPLIYFISAEDIAFKLGYHFLFHDDIAL
jgi:hypothetical protein